MNNKRKFLDTLLEMKGKTFVYGNKPYKILNYSIDDNREKVSIQTDKKFFERNYDSVEEFLKYFEPIIEPEETETQPEVLVITNQVSTEVFTEKNDLAKDLIGILRENIEKVRKDKNYIPQAQAINNNVNSIINVTKMQLDVYKHFKPRKGQLLFLCPLLLRKDN